MTAGNMLRLLTKAYPGVERNILLTWVCYVKNSMMNKLDPSENQLVLRKNPEMPSIMGEDGPGELKGETPLPMMQQHLNRKSRQQQTQPTLVKMEGIRGAASQTGRIAKAIKVEGT